MERWVAAFDVHGDKQHGPSVAAFKAFCKSFKPKVRIMGGDCFDFRWLRKAASDDEKLEQVRADFDQGLDFLHWFKPTVFLRGNHDQRLWDCLDSRAGEGALKHLAADWIGAIEDATIGSLHYPYDKRRGVHRYADHVFLHGYSAGVGAIRKAGLVYGNCCMGHVHRSDIANVEGGERRTAHSSGCLCELDMDYNRASLGTLAQGHGWLYGVRIGQRLTVWHAEEVGGVWVLPSEFRELDYGQAK